MKTFLSNKLLVTTGVSIILVICLFIGYIGYNKSNNDINSNDVYSMASDNKNNISNEELLNITINELDSKISFYANTFGINKDILIEKLKENHENIELLDNNDIDKKIIDYLVSLEKEDKKLFNNKLVPCNEKKEYMVSLIKYYTDIYTTVNFNIAAAIAEVESGYIAKGMLNVNNIFGGMANNGLIKYKNIEYGILKYILLLNDGYFNNGLTTVSKIGYYYNPTINQNGEKVASPTWVTNVTNATNHYNDIESISFDELLNLKNNI